MMFSKHYKKMFCENIYHICQPRRNSLNTNNIKAGRCTQNGNIYQPICHTLHRNRNIIPPQPEHHFSTTGATFSRHKH